MLIDPRRAGQVRRYHTWPRITEQTVAEHSWNVARIMRAVWPDCPVRMIDHCLFHDVGEVQAGDPPYPVKKISKTFGEAHRRVEEDTHLQMCVPWQMPPPAYLEPDEHAIFKLCEFIEMVEWAMDEELMGNQRASLVRLRCSEQVELITGNGSVPPAIADRAARYLGMRKRSNAEDWATDSVLRPPPRDEVPRAG